MTPFNHSCTLNKSKGNIIDACFGGKKHILTLLSTLAFTVKQEAQPVQTKSPIVIEQLQPKKIETPSFDIEVLTPLRAAQAAKQAELDKLAAEEAERVRQAEMARQVVYTPQPISYGNTSGGLIAGSVGFHAGGNNCVDWVKRFRSVPMNNPITWRPTTQTPYIGAIVLFNFNHTALVTGYGNGFIEVSHANAPGAPTRYPMSQIRGFL